VFDLKECSDETEFEFLIDPCNCSTYYQCGHTSLDKRECAPGTWLDLEKSNTCVHSQSKIFDYPCDTPWKRCDTSGNYINDHVVFLYVNKTRTISANVSLNAHASLVSFK